MSNRSSKAMRALVVLMAAAGAFVTILGVPAHAGQQITCAVNGTIKVSRSATGWNWQVSGLGPCANEEIPGFPSIPHVRGSFTGTGTSATLGLCDGLVVTDLKIKVSLQLTNLRTGKVRTINEKWIALVTTFPLATPFLVSGSQSGAGVMFNRTTLSCPPGGSSNAKFSWSQTT
jgi:hypothetical protein